MEQFRGVGAEERNFSFTHLHPDGKRNRHDALINHTKGFSVSLTIFDKYKKETNNSIESDFRGENAPGRI